MTEISPPLYKLKACWCSRLFCFVQVIVWIHQWLNQQTVNFPVTLNLKLIWIEMQSIQGFLTINIDILIFFTEYLLTLVHTIYNLVFTLICVHYIKKHVLYYNCCVSVIHWLLTHGIQIYRNLSKIHYLYDIKQIIYASQLITFKNMIRRNCLFLLLDANVVSFGGY